MSIEAIRLENFIFSVDSCFGMATLKGEIAWPPLHLFKRLVHTSGKSTLINKALQESTRKPDVVFH